MIIFRLWQGQPVIPPRLTEPASWPAGAGLRAFVAAFIVPIFFAFAVQFDVARQPLGSNVHGVVILCLTSLTQILVCMGMLMLETRQPWRQAIELKSMRWNYTLAIGALGFLASLLPVFGVNLIVGWLGWHAPESRHPLLKMLENDNYSLVRAGIFVSAAILAPLAEELMYRVALQTELERYLSGGTALVVTAGLFAGVHSLGGRPDALPLLPLALILGYVYRQTRSYPAVVVLHALFNALNLAMTFLMKAPPPA